jgi:hypothetical protein
MEVELEISFLSLARINQLELRILREDCSSIRLMKTGSIVMDEFMFTIYNENVFMNCDYYTLHIRVDIRTWQLWYVAGNILEL